MATREIKVSEMLKVLENQKLTKPQQKVVDRLKEGYRLGIKNPHYQSSGEIVWVDPNSGEPEYAGHIYRAVQYLYFKVERLLGCSDVRITDLYTKRYWRTKGWDDLECDENGNILPEKWKCPVCGKNTSFISGSGVCEECEEKGIWIDPAGGVIMMMKRIQP